MRVLSFILILVIFFTSYSCQKQDSYSETPAIYYNSLTVQYKTYPDNDVKLVGILNFDFIDGDGNIGFAENDDDNNTNTQDTIIPDIFITEYFKKDGIFQPKIKGPYTMPYFDDKVYKTLKGEIEIYFIHENYSPDTVYYECYIIDRDYNQSNIITTDTIIYSEYFK
ncbi:MAG TPA: hypothetical protein P5132_02755 [Bacteroidales bacterium]|nr:hypothetical protein [Bacteroidales bacterium]